METKEAISILEKMFDSSDEMHESTDGDEYFWNQMQALDMGIKSLKEKSDDKMKCPYRISTITIRAEVIETTKEMYCDCYEDKCPYYVPKKYVGEGERCRKTEE